MGHAFRRLVMAYHSRYLRVRSVVIIREHSGFGTGKNGRVIDMIKLRSIETTCRSVRRGKTWALTDHCVISFFKNSFYHFII